MLEIDLKELTTNYNQLIYEYKLCKQSNEQIIEQMESDNQRRTQYDKDFKQLQQQVNNLLNKEKQMQNDFNQSQKENQRLIEELNRINNKYETINAKLMDYEEQVEGLNSFSSTRIEINYVLLYLVENKVSVLYRTQMKELKDEINELTEKLWHAHNEQKNIADEK
jgi:chromosome segregation ATPase